MLTNTELLWLGTWPLNTGCLMGAFHYSQGCQPPMSSNIKNWWGMDDRWCRNAQHITSFVKKKKNSRKGCCWNCNVWPAWFTSHQITLLLILQWHTRVCEETFDVNSKIAQTTQNIWNPIVRKSNLQEMANFDNYPGDFRL